MKINKDINGKKHALITLFDKSKIKKFPLILIIGREPNNKNKVSNKVGQYSFEDAPRSAFWNISYKKIGEIINLNTKEFKELCNKRKSSPIAYTNALPLTIQDKIKNKTRIRKQFSDKKLDKHIKKIFSKSSVMKRVDLIILSGLDKNEMKRPKDKINSYAKDLKIPILEVKYFHGTNSKKINFDRLVTRKIKRILNNWNDQF